MFSQYPRGFPLCCLVFFHLLKLCQYLYISGWILHEKLLLYQIYSKIISKGFRVAYSTELILLTSTDGHHCSISSTKQICCLSLEIFMIHDLSEHLSDLTLSKHGQSTILLASQTDMLMPVSPLKHQRGQLFSIHRCPLGACSVQCHFKRPCHLPSAVD